MDCLQFAQFKRFVAHRPTCYADGWLYHLRSARNANGSIGFQFLRQNAYATIGFQRNHTVCVSPTGVDRFEFVPELCHLLAVEKGEPVLLKKVDQELYAYLRTQTGFFPCQHSDDVEDENFPEHVIDLETLFNNDGTLNRNAKHLKRREKRFERNVGPLFSRGVIETSGSLSDDLNRMLKDSCEKRLAYAQMCQFVESYVHSSTKFYVRAYYCQNQQMHGLYLAEELTKGTAGLYCAVTSRSFPDSTEWMDVDFFRMLHQSGIQKLFLGGSETPGVHQYVKKLLPRELPTTMRPLIFRNSSLG